MALKTIDQFSDDNYCEINTKKYRRNLRKFLAGHRYLMEKKQENILSTYIQIR